MGRGDEGGLLVTGGSLRVEYGVRYVLEKARLK